MRRQAAQNLAVCFQDILILLIQLVNRRETPEVRNPPDLRKSVIAVQSELSFWEIR